MSKGVLLIAHNSENTDYYQMAAYTADRVRTFLNLPVSIITDSNSITCDYKFDNVILREPDTSNMRKKSTWINKGRWQVYDLTPYKQTLVLDTDYMINSNKLTALFSSTSDFMCHKNCKYLFEDTYPERIGKNGLTTLWATVMMFTKTTRTKELFGMMRMIQDNYQHYSELHNFVTHTYRNDYALTLALHTVNGHCHRASDYIPWNLLHVGLDTTVSRISDIKYRFDRKLDKNKEVSVTNRPQYMLVKDCDFHMLSKDNFMKLTNMESFG